MLYILTAATTCFSGSYRGVAMVVAETPAKITLKYGQCVGLGVLLVSKLVIVSEK